MLGHRAKGHCLGPLKQGAREPGWLGQLTDTTGASVALRGGLASAVEPCCMGCGPWGQYLPGLVLGEGCSYHVNYNLKTHAPLELCAGAVVIN